MYSIGTSPFLRIALRVAMETMYLYIAEIRSFLENIFWGFQGVPINSLAPIKNCPGVQGRSD